MRQDCLDRLNAGAERTHGGPSTARRNHRPRHALENLMLLMDRKRGAKRTQLGWRILALLCLVGGVRADDAAKPPAAVESITFEQETLPNGLKVIYAPLRQAPVA